MLPVDPINQARYVPFHVNHTQEKNQQTKEVTDFLKRDPTQQKILEAPSLITLNLVWLEIPA